MQLHPMAEKILPRVAAHRRALHRIPEEGLSEFKTHAYLMRELALLRPNALNPLCGTGIKCVFRGDGDGRNLAFRADIDALRIQEKTGLPFASQHEGMMHACGHDGHMAALLGLAACVSAIRDTGYLAGNVTLIFQPAEESCGGAARMIAEGALEDPHVDEVYGLHLFPDVPLGYVSCCAGPMMASDYEFDLDITGKDAHVAMPQHGANALDAANALYTRLKALPQLTDPTELALFNIGRMEGGEQRNVVPKEANIQCVLRTYTTESLCDLRDRIDMAVEGTARAYGVVIALKDKVFYPAVDNPREMVSRLEAQVGGRFIPQKRLLIAEDFSYYQRERPGLFFFVGTGEAGHPTALHADTFDFAPEALGVAVSSFLDILLDRMM
jgi:amidohydrolase